MVEKLLKEEEKSVEKELLHNFSFPKSLKIKKTLEYKSFNHSKKRAKGSFITLDYRFNEKIHFPRLGITISSKIAKAHIRNKFKRQIREIFRLNQHNLDNNIEIHIRARSISQDLKYTDLEKDFLNLISLIKK